MIKVDPILTASPAAIKALIIYDDTACAARVSAALHRAGHNADMNVEWDIRPLRLDALRRIPEAHEALVEASGAHLILFAGGLAQSFPSLLERWLERWAATRRIEDATLAVMNRLGGGMLSSAISPLLNDFAERHGLTFIVEQDSVGGAELMSLGDSPTDRLPMPPSARSRNRQMQFSVSPYLSRGNHNFRMK
jgi:hypothetical protein